MMPRKTKHQKRIIEFMHKAGQEVPTEPIIPSREVRKLRATLILEEALETIEALGFQTIATTEGICIGEEIYDPDLVEIADGCADISVVTIGTLAACGISDEAILEEVDKSNLDKFKGDSYRREDGKWIKPTDWQPPRIKEILNNQRKTKC